MEPEVPFLLDLLPLGGGVSLGALVSAAQPPPPPHPDPSTPGLGSGEKEPRQNWIGIPALSLAGCVALDKHLHLSEPQTTSSPGDLWGLRQVTGVGHGARGLLIHSVHCLNIE